MSNMTIFPTGMKYDPDAVKARRKKRPGRKGITDYEVIEALYRNQGNVRRSANDLGISDRVLRKRLAGKPDLMAVCERLRKQAAEGKLETKERIAEARRRARAKARKKEKDEDTIAMNDEELYVVIVECEGNLLRVAEEINCDLMDIKRRMKKNPSLAEAVKEGEEYRMLRAEELMKGAALGDIQVPTNQQQALRFLLKTIGGWSEKKKVEHSGALVYDANTVPDDDIEPDLPDLRIIGNDE